MLIHLKEDNISVNDAIEDLNDHFINEGDKLSDTEKTALNVITLEMIIQILDRIIYRYIIFFKVD
jgi:hypothetical protein